MTLKWSEGTIYLVDEVREGSGTARAGLLPGDRILALQGKALNGPKALRRAMLDLRGRSRAEVIVTRGRQRALINEVGQQSKATL